MSPPICPEATLALQLTLNLSSLRRYVETCFFLFPRPTWNLNCQEPNPAAAHTVCAAHRLQWVANSLKSLKKKQTFIALFMLTLSAVQFLSLAKFKLNRLCCFITTDKSQSPSSPSSPCSWALVQPPPHTPTHTHRLMRLLLLCWHADGS